MDSTRPLKVFCGIWHQDVSSRSFKSCKLRGGASIDLTCLSIPQTLDCMKIWGIRSQINTLNSDQATFFHYSVVQWLCSPIHNKVPCTVWHLSIRTNTNFTSVESPHALMSLVWFTLFLPLTTLDTDHCRLGPSHRRSGFGDSLTQLYLVKLAQILTLAHFSCI